MGSERYTSERSKIADRLTSLFNSLRDTHGVPTYDDACVPTVYINDTDDTDKIEVDKQHPISVIFEPTPNGFNIKESFDRAISTANKELNEGKLVWVHNDNLAPPDIAEEVANFIFDVSDRIEIKGCVFYEVPELFINSSSNTNTTDLRSKITNSIFVENNRIEISSSAKIKRSLLDNATVRDAEIDQSIVSNTEGNGSRVVLSALKDGPTITGDTTTISRSRISGSGTIVGYGAKVDQSSVTDGADVTGEKTWVYDSSIYGAETIVSNGALVYQSLVVRGAMVTGPDTEIYNSMISDSQTEVNAGALVYCSDIEDGAIVSGSGTEILPFECTFTIREPAFGVTDNEFFKSHPVLMERLFSYKSTVTGLDTVVSGGAKVIGSTVERGAKVTGGCTVTAITLVDPNTTVISSHVRDDKLFEPRKVSGPNTTVTTDTVSRSKLTKTKRFCSVDPPYNSQ